MSDPSQILQGLVDLLAGGRSCKQKPDLRQPLFVALARLLSAAARADGPIVRAEQNRVKALLAPLRPRLTARELLAVMLDLEQPVGARMWDELIADVAARATRRAEVQLVLARLRDLLEVDGPINDEERAVLSRVELGLGQLSVPGSLGSFGSPTGVRAAANTPSPGEAVLIRVLADLQQMADRQADPLRQAHAPLDKLCVFAAAAAYVLGGDASQPVDATVAGALAGLFGVADSAAGYVLERATELAARSEEGGRSAARVAAELEEWGSAVELRPLYDALAAARGARGKEQRLQGLFQQPGLLQRPERQEGER